MTKHLTPAQQEAIKACITTQQRVEFLEGSPAFFVSSAEEIHLVQFIHLPEPYEIHHVRLAINPDTFEKEVCVMFWLE